MKAQSGLNAGDSLRTSTRTEQPAFALVSSSPKLNSTVFENELLLSQSRPLPDVTFIPKPHLSKKRSLFIAGIPPSTPNIDSELSSGEQDKEGEIIGATCSSCTCTLHFEFGANWTRECTSQAWTCVAALTETVNSLRLHCTIDFDGFTEFCSVD